MDPNAGAAQARPFWYRAQGLIDSANGANQAQETNDSMLKLATWSWITTGQGSAPDCSRLPGVGAVLVNSSQPEVA